MRHEIKIKHRDSRLRWKYGEYGRASGSVNGVAFEAKLVKADHALRGAEPLVWQAWSPRGRLLTKGERLAIAMRLKRSEEKKSEARMFGKKKRPDRDEKIEREIEGIGHLEIPVFAASESERLMAWRSVLAKREILVELQGIAEMAQEIRKLESRLYEKAAKIAEEAEILMPIDGKLRECHPNDMTDASGQHWYEIAIDAKNGTAHEALARFCEAAWRCYPENYNEKT